MISFATASVLAVAIAGCGGGGSSNSYTPVAAPAAPAVAPPANSPAAPAVSLGTPVTYTAASQATNFPTLVPQVDVGGVAINSPPVITFAIRDASGNGIAGLGDTNQSATATLPSLALMRFSIAKLVPGSNGSPSKWVNYIVTSVPTKNATTGAITAAAPRTPTTDNTGKLTDYGTGLYTYQFGRDITKIKDEVAAMTFSGNNKLADLGDLTYDPTLPHRVTIQISGNARGTGTNTADGSNSGVTAVPMANPINVIYDFIPATGKKLSFAELTREVVAVKVCNECHDKLTLHGSRNETQYCVVCHTDQLRYGSADTLSVANATTKVPEYNGSTFKETATVNATTGITSYAYSPSVSVADGVAMGNFPVMVHRIHNGGTLVKDNYNFANVVYDKKGFSMLGNGQRMCIKCHDNTQATNADNHKKVPSRVACGACHDGINWADGTGSTLADKGTFDALKTAKGSGTGANSLSTATLAASGHAGKGQADDSKCALCHTSADVPVYHRTENVTTHNPTVKPGLVHFTYQINSASVNSTSNDVTINFTIKSATADSTGTLGAATAVTLKAAASGLADPLTGFTGGPSFLLAYATSQDGITTPIDYNNSGVKQAQALSITLGSLLNTATTATTANTTTVGSLSAQAADGSYTATLLGAGSTVCGGSATPVKCVFPVGAKLRTVGLQGYFTQAAGTNGITTATARHAISAVKAIDSTTASPARRIIVDNAKCANCHEWFEGHGGNRVSNIEICVMCHVPGMATSGRGIADTTMAAWTWTPASAKIISDWSFNQQAVNAALKFPVTTNNFKDMIHGIHAGRERVTPFVDARDRTSGSGATATGEITLLDFRRMDFPGNLYKCETCHKTGTYGDVPANALASTYESIDAAYAAGITASTATPAMAKTALNTANTTDKVSSPFAAACVSCHDSTLAKNHIASQNGLIIQDRSVFQTAVSTAGKGETCSLCHGLGKAEDITVKHKK